MNTVAIKLLEKAAQNRSQLSHLCQNNRDQQRPKSGRARDKKHKNKYLDISVVISSGAKLETAGWSLGLWNWVIHLHQNEFFSFIYQFFLQQEGIQEAKYAKVETSFNALIWIARLAGERIFIQETVCLECL